MAVETTMQQAAAYAMYKRARVAEEPKRAPAQEQLELDLGESLLTPKTGCTPEDGGRTPIADQPVFEDTQRTAMVGSPLFERSLLIETNTACFHGSREPLVRRLCYARRSGKQRAA